MFEKRILLFLLLLTSCIAFIGCSPKYPNCDNDGDCATNEKGKAEGKLMCVNGVCQQCRLDTDCAGEGMMCDAGVCSRIENYCNSKKDCLEGYSCRDNRCISGCVDNTDCGEGLACKGGKCVDPLACTLKSDCEGGFDCIGGRCVDPASLRSDCSLDEIHFDYDSSSLETGIQGQLQAVAECIKKKDLRVRIEGHADERGTSEYNLALGERRARNTYNYLVQLGVQSGNLSTISYGEEKLQTHCGEEASDSCHRQNRRVVFDVR